MDGGIHRTYLAEDGCAKAHMAKPKMMLGPCDGVVMLMPMTADGLLGIGEGIETSLAAAKIFSGIPGLGGAVDLGAEPPVSARSAASRDFW